jgi:rubredoxin
VSPLRLTIIILIAILFTTGFVLTLVNYSKIKKKEKFEWEIKNTVTCPSCGLKYVKGIKYCTACGYTFEKPGEYKNY